MAIVAQGRDDVAQFVKGRVEVVHAAPLAGVGRQPALLHHLRRHRLELPLVGVVGAHDAVAIVVIFIVRLEAAQRRGGGAGGADPVGGFGRRCEVVAGRRRVVMDDPVEPVR